MYILLKISIVCKYFVIFIFYKEFRQKRVRKDEILEEMDTSDILVRK